MLERLVCKVVCNALVSVMSACQMDLWGSRYDFFFLEMMGGRTFSIVAKPWLEMMGEEGEGHFGWR